MLKKNNGFTLVEVLVASSILFMMIIVIIPINTLLTTERTILKDRHEFKQTLQEELQPFIWETNKELPATYVKEMNHKSVSFQFTRQPDNLIKGCVQWENVRNQREKICLYGYPP